MSTRDDTPPPQDAGIPPAAAGRDINIRDIIAGLVVIAISVLALWLARDYGFGTLRRMRAGFFPNVLAWAGVGLGTLIMVRGFLVPADEPAHPLRLRRLLFITAAFATFGLGIDPLGLPLTVFLTSLVGSMGDRESQAREALLLALGLAVGISVLFIGLLGLPLPLYPGFF